MVREGDGLCSSFLDCCVLFVSWLEICMFVIVLDAKCFISILGRRLLAERVINRTRKDGKKVESLVEFSPRDDSEELNKDF